MASENQDNALELVFEPRPLAGTRFEGVDLGHVTLRLGGREVSTRKGPAGPRALMLYPTVVMLLDGVRSLVEGTAKVHRAVGVGADLGIELRLQSGGYVTVSSGGEELGRVALEALRRALLEACATLARAWPLDPDDMVQSDYDQAVRELSRARVPVTPGARRGPGGR